MSTADARTEALEQLRAAVRRSLRKQRVPFGKWFLRGNDDNAARLAPLIQGGRGGEVRLKIYLTITMMATRAPHDLQRPPPPRLWATMLALPGPTAPRRASSGLRWLHAHKYIQLTPRIGHVPAVTLLDSVSGDGPWVRPMDRHERYISMPLQLWSEGWIVVLSATELALLMIIMDIQRGKSAPAYASREDHEAYGVSSDTWTRATKGLKSKGLLTIRREPQGNDFDFQRMRSLYQVNTERLQSQPDW